MECPHCKSDNVDFIELTDYEFDGSKYYAYWKCECADCEKTFKVVEEYHLANTTICE